MNEVDAMRSELASVLADPSFIRSPVLARLLRYLVETTINGEGRSLKSYSVAVEGLGRSADFDSQVDTYARVQVARLRKALDAFYATSGATRPRRLQVESGSYEVSLVANGDNASQALPVPARRRWMPALQLRKRWVAAALLIGLLLGIVGSCVLYGDYRQEQWRTPDFPWVDVEVVAEDNDAFTRHQVDDFRKTLMVSLSRYEGLRVKFMPDDTKSDYNIHAEMGVVDGELREEVFVVYEPLDRVVWSDAHRFGTDRAGWSSAVDAYHEQLVFRISHSSGAIHAFERHWNRGASTPYGCWLRFSGQLQENRDFDDAVLRSCAAKWYDAAPDHSLAASLEGWVLLDESMQSITDAGRRDKIARAVDLLERNAMLNPSSTFAHASLMRAYNYAGDYHAALDSGTEAMAANPANIDLVGMVGTTMALNNDPRGEAIVKDAIARHFNAPPWYFVGAFLGAMMREDTVAARAALHRVTEFNHSLPVLAILSAALEARTGNIALARKDWARARAAHPLLRVQPQLLFDRLPMAPAVRRKLLQWLGPVLD